MTGGGPELYAEKIGNCAVGMFRFPSICEGAAWIGEDITRIELGGVRKYFADGAVEPKHVTLSLIGSFKQLEGEQQPFLPVAAVTGYGIKIREWVDILLLEKSEVGLTLGFLFLKKDGSPAKVIYFEEALLEILAWIQQNTTGIIPLTVNSWEDFGVRRSMHRCATTEALNTGIDAPTIDVNNSWRKVKAAKGKMPRYSMRQRYTQVFQDLKHQLMFSLDILLILPPAPSPTGHYPP
jgi:hypothetical protein